MAQVKASVKTKAVEEKKPVTAVAVREEAGVPAHLAGKQGITGITSGIDREDVALPRVKIGQSLTEAVKSGAMKDGTLYLNIGDTELAAPKVKQKFVVLGTAKEYILWRPRKDNGGGILARARPVMVEGERKYAWDKPNTTFEVKIDGKTPAKWHTKQFIEDDGLAEWGSEFGYNADGSMVNKDSGIAATAHHNYVIVFPDLGDIVAAFSLSRSSAKRAKDLNALLKMGDPTKIPGRLFDVVTVAEKSTQGEFFNVKFSPAGWATAEQFDRYNGMAAAFANKTIVVDQSDGGDDEATDERA